VLAPQTQCPAQATREIGLIIDRGNGPGKINRTAPPGHGSTTVRLTEPELEPKKPAKKGQNTIEKRETHSKKIDT
jgi:hypothetical protein